MDFLPHALIAGGPVTVAYDVTGSNLGHAPQGSQLCGYTTGSHGIPWTTAQFAAHPGTVRIDQDPAASDPTADVLDVEAGAATPADCPGWAKRAQADFTQAKRPGQRWPAIYFSASNVHNVANALINGGVRSGVGLWIADWSFTQAEAFADVINAAGPFPIIGVQWRSGQFYDTDVFSSKWLANVSHKPAAGPFKHATDGKLSLTAIAASRQMRVGTWLKEQQDVGGDTVAAALGSAVPKAGLTWFSVNP